MGGMLTQPVTDKRSDEGKGLGLSYGLSYMQGWRSEMEDAHDVKIGLRYGLEDWSYFAVFDGHAGKHAASFAALNLLEFILRDTQFKLNTEDLPEYICVEPDLIKKRELKKLTRKYPDTCHQLFEHYRENCEEPWVDVCYKPCCIIIEFVHTGDDWPDGRCHCPQPDSVYEKLTQLSSPEPSHSSPETDLPENDTQSEPNATQSDKIVPKLSKFAKLPVLEQLEIVERAIKSAFLRIDDSMRDVSPDMSGCTAVCILVSPTHLFIANCGDSRAVLYDGSSEPKFATEDHKPSKPTERRRIIDAGGAATQRINGTLAVSRALGDFEFKRNRHKGPCEQLVSPEPEVTVIERHPEDKFLVLACDGIWDVMDNMNLCEFIDYKLKVEPSLKNVCSAVLDVCLRKNSRDNMSIIIVVFENGPKFSEIELERDLKNDEYITEVIRAVSEEKQDDFVDFFFYLKEYRLSEIRNRLEEMGGYLPPGAELEAKWDLIHDLFNKEFQFKQDSKTYDE